MPTIICGTLAALEEPDVLGTDALDRELVTRIEPMRILNITQSYYPFLARGGPAVKVHAMSRGLAARGHKVTVLTTDLGFSAAGREVSGAVRDRSGWRTVQDSVEVVYLHPCLSYRTVTWSPGVSGFCRRRLADFDVVHIYGLYDLLGPAVARACRRAGIPYVIEPMGMYRPIIRSIRLKRAYLRWMGAPMARNARRLIATSEQEERELVEEGIPEHKVVIRRNGVECPESLPAAGTFRRRWKIAAEAPLVLFLGRLVSKKSPDLLLDAFARWQGTSPCGRTAMLVLAGPDEHDGYPQELQKAATRFGIADRVLFPGPLYDSEKWSAYRDADVFVLPSQNENFGNTAAEAVVCGTPVLVTNQCGVAPLIEGRAALVVSHDREALTHGLARLMSDSALRESLRGGCAEVARGLSWEEPLSETEALYAEIARSTERGSVARQPSRREKHGEANVERKIRTGLE